MGSRGLFSSLTAGTPLHSRKTPDVRSYSSLSKVSVFCGVLTSQMTSALSPQAISQPDLSKVTVVIMPLLCTLPRSVKLLSLTSVTMPRMTISLPEHSFSGATICFSYHPTLAAESITAAETIAAAASGGRYGFLKSEKAAAGKNIPAAAMITY